MQPNPQEVKDAIREAIRNITHASTKDQYLEQLQHTNDLERQPKTKAGNQPEANVETPIQPELQPQMPGLQQPAPIANVNPISILVEPAQREPTPIETPKQNESEIVQYVGKTREQVANDRPYLQPINFKKETFGFKSSDTKPFEGVGNIFNSPFVKLEKQTLKDKILQAAEERQRLSKQNEQLVVLGPEPPPPEPAPTPLKPLPGWEDEPQPPPPKEKKKHGIAQRLAEYDNPEIVRILTDYKLFDIADKGKHRQTLIYKYSNLLEGKRVKWKNYKKSTK
jgi:hypothetical protein